MVAATRLKLKTQGNGDIIDITPEVAKAVARSDIRNGTVTVFVTGSTAGVTTIEFEPGLVSDFQEFWERVIPRKMPYKHDSTWGESNGFSHVRASLLGSSLVVPLVERVMTLGTWQQIVVVDFDHRPREREVVVHITGD